MIEWIVQTFVITTLLAVCIWGICRVGRVGPAWRHALWLVLMLKLMMPPLVNWPWTVHHSIVPIDPQTATPRESPATTTALPNDRERLLAEIDPAAPAPIQIRNAKPPLVRSPAISDWLVPGIAFIWFAGFATFAFIQIKRIRCLARLLRIAAPAGPGLTALVREVAAHLNAPAVETKIVAGIASPFVSCIYRPVLLWPAELSSKLSEESVRALLAHELAHLKRRDHVVGWLELAAGCLWWWNPVYWCIRHQLRENAELACDAWAIHAMDSTPGVRHAYAEALLSVCESIADPKPSNPMPVVGVDTGNRRFLERRLTMIVRDRLPFRLSRSGLLLTVLIALTLLPMWSLSAPAAETATTTAVVAQTNPGTPTQVEVAPRSIKEYPLVVQAPAIELGPIEHRLNEGLFKVVEPSRLEHEVRGWQGGTPGAAASNDGTADTALNRRIDLNFSNATLKTALDYLRDSGDLNLYVPWRMLKSLGVEESAPVNLKLRDVPLRRALGLVLADATADNSLTYFVEDGVIEVTTREAVTTRPWERAFNDVWLGNRQLFEEGKFIDDPAWIEKGFAESKGLTWSVPAEVQILQLRDRVGESIELEVTGQLTGPVWGDGVYTDDSTLGAAAVHAGLLKPGETGIIRVTSMPGRPRYEGSTRNGVRSQSFARWDGSYRLERVK